VDHRPGRPTELIQSVPQLTLMTPGPGGTKIDFLIAFTAGCWFHPG
jgi:hypothetical protein